MVERYWQGRTQRLEEKAASVPLAHYKTHMELELIAGFRNEKMCD
jgi:hypothetical protein